MKNSFTASINTIDLKVWLEKYAEIKPYEHGEIRLRLCPKCGNEKHKLYVNTEKLIWNCFRCGWGRGQKDICVLMAEVSGRNVNDIRQEISRFVIPIPQDDVFVEKLEGVLFHKPKKERKFKVESVEMPGTSDPKSVVWKTVQTYASRRGLSFIELEKLGIKAVGSMNNYHGPYMVFPVVYDGQIVAYQGRRVFDKEPKYVSSDHIHAWLYPIDAPQLYVYKYTQTVVIVEGFFDAIALWHCDKPAVCSFGKRISSAQIDLLHRMGVKNVILAWDPDAQDNIEEAALRLKTQFSVYIADLTKAIEGSTLTKLDPGATLVDRSWQNWLKARIDNAFSVNDPEFFNWQLRKALKR